MDPDRFPPLSRCRTVVVSWADLQPELLAAIAHALQYPMDVDRFRSVCRQWRLSICPPPPPNKISHLFPRGVSLCLKPHYECESLAAKYLIARAVYLLRPTGEPSKAWMVSVEEINPGKLLLRHPLTYKEEQGSPTNFMDLSEWSLTRIATSYRFRIVYGRGKSMKQCSQCNYSVRTKVILVSNSESEDMALYNYDSFSLPTKLCAIRLSLSDQISASQCVGGLQKGIRDFVNFNARIYAVDMGARVYLFDSTSLQLLQMKRGNFIDSLWAKGSFKRFVVSEGHLYLVLKFCPRLGTWRDCRIYKLVMDDSDPTFYNLEKVENLGDRVFFINPDCCFSVSHRDLPPP